MAKKDSKPGEEKALRQRPAESAMSPWDEMERWLEGYGRRDWLRPGLWDWPQLDAIATFRNPLPKIDLLDRESEIVVRAELPGVARDDLKVAVTDDSVTLKAHIRHEEKEEAGEYLRREMSYGDYQRTVPLPHAVDGANAKATFTAGVLELTLPKVAKTLRKKVKVE